MVPPEPIDSRLPMSHTSRKSVDKPIVSAYACLFFSLLVLVSFAVWSALHDVRLIGKTITGTEISRLRAQATRRAGHLEGGLQHETDSNGNTDWHEIRERPWLKTYWDVVSTQSQEGQLYAAIVDASGTIVLHSDSNIVNRALGDRWYDRVVTDVGDDVVETDGKILSSGEPAYDIRLPIEVNGQQIGSYHEGLSIAWVDQRVSELRGPIVRQCMLMIGGILVLVALSVVSLSFIIRRRSSIELARDAAELRRVAELGQIAAGLAHEIRNPLHAIRLNLHTFRRTYHGEAELDSNEIVEMIDQSSSEIDRLEHLMNELLGFASPKEAREEVIDLTMELKTTLDFIEQELLHRNVNVRADFPSTPVRVRMDPGRLRQILLNLLVNAQDAVEEGGEIRMAVRRVGSRAEVVVSDNGPGVSEAERERIFEPFYSTKSSGSGLGLPMVRRFVEEAHGTIQCEGKESDGATFRITLPLIPESK
ncbi:MAG: hypothetical protein DWQ35_19735 [Planctomycetota bacterium]|nr:MAG: hypothetical protein DWQ35_19735 [Planctomycetota bacterium]